MNGTAPCLIGFAGIPEHTRDVTVGSTKRIFFDVRRAEEGNESPPWADPDTLRVKILNGEEAETSELLYGTDAEIVRDDVGNYFVDVALIHPGRWVFRVEAEGELFGAAEAEFYVPASAFDEA